MEERSDDRLVIEAHLGEDLGDLYGMVDVGFARCTALFAVGVGAEHEGAMDGVDLGRVEVGTGKAAENR